MKLEICAFIDRAFEKHIVSKVDQRNYENNLNDRCRGKFGFYDELNYRDGLARKAKTHSRVLNAYDIPLDELAPEMISEARAERRLRSQKT